MVGSRDEVHAALTEQYGQRGALHVPPPELGAYFDDAAIIRVAKKYMEQTTDVATGGRAIVVGAGPPGAGKNAALQTLSLNGYRVIDPDEAKDMLLDEAQRHRLLDYRYGVLLPDGGPVGL